MERNITNYCMVIDTTGLRCPLPVLKVRKNLPILNKADLFLIIADDPLAEIDLRHFCNAKSYKVRKISSNQSDEKHYFEIKR